MLIKTSKPECVWKSKALLGEGVLWVKSLQSIFFVDIKKRKIFILNIYKKSKKILKVDKEIGFISHVKENIFILGLKSEIRIVNLKTKKTIFSLNIEPKYPNNRINDGKIDPIGRLWFGTMDNVNTAKSGALYCLDNNLKLHKVDDKYYITNGPAFINKYNFYHTDSKKKIIYNIKINKNFKIIKKTIFKKFDKKYGSPDGMTTDIKNNLWVCHYHVGFITVYNVKGKMIKKIKFPAKNITNCTFAGKTDKEIFLTTARSKMKANEIAKYPLSGGLFKILTNVKGKKTRSYKQSILKL